MEAILIIGVLIAIGLAIGSAMIASSKGRSGGGWFVLTLIFPIAILFVAIAGPVSGAAQERPAQNPSPTRNPVSPLSQTASHTATSNEQPSHSDQAKTLDWDKLLKYDPDVTKAVEKLQAHGDPAVEEFKEAYEAVGGDRTVINHITDVIRKEFEEKEARYHELNKHKKNEKERREILYSMISQKLESENKDKLHYFRTTFGAKLIDRGSDIGVYVQIGPSRSFIIKSSNYSGENELFVELMKSLSDEELEKLLNYSN